MDHKNISQRTLQESKNIPVPKKPVKFNYLFWAGILFTLFTTLFICVLPSAIEEEEGIFGILLGFIMFGCISSFFFYLSHKHYIQQCKDYELSKTNRKEYQITVQLRKEQADQQYQQYVKNAQNEYAKQQAVKLQRKTDLANGILKCPKCGSGHIATVNRGYTITTGFIGSGKAVNVCQVCGHRFTPGT